MERMCSSSPTVTILAMWGLAGRTGPRIAIRNVAAISHSWWCREEVAALRHVVRDAGGGLHGSARPASEEFRFAASVVQDPGDPRGIADPPDSGGPSSRSVRGSVSLEPRAHGPVRSTK